MYNLKPKICEACGKEFIPASGHQKICMDCREGYYSNYYQEYYQAHKERYSELRLRNYHKGKSKAKVKSKPVSCHDYAERQKAKTIEMYARVKVE